LYKHPYKRLALLLCCALLLTGLLAGCGKEADQTITSLDQLAESGRRIGVPGNIPEYETLKQRYPEATVVAYTDETLGYEDVVLGRIDAYVQGRYQMELAIESGIKGVRLLDENLSKNQVAVGISPVSPIPDLPNQINAFLAEQKANGTLDDMFRRWVVEAERTMPEIELPAEPTCHLRVGTTGTVMPYSYYVGPSLAGYDIELATRFAAWLGADLELKVYDFGGIIAAAASGDVDCIMSNLFHNPGQDAGIPFSDSVMEVNMTAMVRTDSKSQATAQVSDFAHARIGVLTGSNIPELVLAALPEAEILYYNSTADQVNAVKSGKADAAAIDEPAGRNMMAEDPALTMVPELLDSMDYAFALGKTERGQVLCDELSDFLRSLKADGRLEALQKKWFDSPDVAAVEMTDYRDLPAVNGTVKLAAFEYPPFVLMKEELTAGYEVELIALFCQERGYALEVSNISSDAIMPSVQTGKSDIGCCCISVTEERKENVLFSEPEYSGGTALLIVSASANEGNFLQSIQSSFEKTFIRENRWKLFVAGIYTTLTITALSIVLGTLLGFAVFMLCRNGNPVANRLTGFFVWLVDGMPVVVLLMILYYIIFGQVAISGVTVSVIGFTLIFASAVFAMLKSGVSAVDRGQVEAAYALGYTDNQSFFRVVLPQALPHFMPAYKGQIVSLIKATAVVGYVAVQDLTKMGDIVRSRTYEAFFPLIAVAVFYFVLAELLIFVVNRIELRIDPRRRSKEEIFKGLNVRESNADA